MNKANVLLTAEADERMLQPLEALCQITRDGWNVKKPVFGEDELIQRLPGKQILLTSYDKVTRKVFENAPELKFIICTRSTPANIDLAAAQEHGVPVCNTPGRNSDVTAEFAVGLLLDIARNITFGNRAIMNRSLVTDDETEPELKKTDMTWPTVKGISPYKTFQGAQIKGKNVGVVGLGSIGGRVARILREGFGARILVYDPYLQPMDEPDMKTVDFDTMLREADFITCHTKICPDTIGMFNYAAFQKMKRTAFFINNSRGAIVVEPDLIRALDDKLIAGAALDVFAYEPLYQGHPFLSGRFHNVLMTPHISGASPDAITTGTQMMVEETLRFLRGEKLRYCVHS